MQNEADWHGLTAEQRSLSIVFNEMAIQVRKSLMGDQGNGVRIGQKEAFKELQP